MPIHVLDEHTINKIAAGEVIERPSSIVKELVENSIDAGATYIEVDVAQGGIKSIRITDNGHGISKDDLPLAPIRHATSKIQSLDDIYQTFTMGFRGEALASVAHISKCRIVSKPATQEKAYAIDIECGDILPLKEASHPDGTTIEVRDIFRAIPVRRQYLKTPGTELLRIQSQLLPMMLIHPDIDIALTNEGVEVLSSVGISDQKSLMKQFFGKTVDGHLVKLDTTRNGLHITGWVTDPTVTFSNRSKQVTAVNKRLITHPAIRKIIQDVYRDVIPSGRFPALVLSIEIEPQSIDVNIHPKKEEIKFLNTDVLFRTLPSVLRAAFSREHAISMNPHPAQSYSSPLSSPQPSPITPLKNPVSPPVLNAVSQTMSDTMPPMASTKNELGEQVPPIHFSNPETVRKTDPSSLFLDEDLHRMESEVQGFFQVFDSYIVLKTGQGLWILDQHAVHERVLYESIKDEKMAALEVKQPLLISEIVEVDSVQMQTFSEYKEWFQSLGIDIDNFGPHQLAVRQVPVIFSECRIGEWVSTLLTDIDTFGANPGQLPDKKEDWQMQACKAAIKAGNKLHPSEIKQLCEQFVAAPSNFTCPHGRPLFKHYSKSDLEKLFLRT